MSKDNKCYFCNKKIPETVIICPNCGQDQRRNRNYIILLVSVLLFWAVVTFSFVYINSDSTIKSKTIEEPKKEGFFSTLFGGGKSSEPSFGAYLKKLGLSEHEISLIRAQIPQEYSDEECIQMYENLYGSLGISSDDIAQIQEAFGVDPSIQDYDIDQSMEAAEETMNAFFETITDPETFNGITPELYGTSDGSLSNSDIYNWGVRVSGSSGLIWGIESIEELGSNIETNNPVDGPLESDEFTYIKVKYFIENNTGDTVTPDPFENAIPWVLESRTSRPIVIGGSLVIGQNEIYPVATGAKPIKNNEKVSFTGIYEITPGAMSFRLILDDTFISFKRINI